MRSAFSVGSFDPLFQDALERKPENLTAQQVAYLPYYANPTPRPESEETAIHGNLRIIILVDIFRTEASILVRISCPFN
jgi:hypothetical protein